MKPRDPNRIPQALAALSELWHKWPDLRLGQLILNVTALNDFTGDLFYVEDEKLVAMIEKVNERIKLEREKSK